MIFYRNYIKLAVQVLSYTMAATMPCIATKELTSNTGENTADFISFINNLFDCLNSRSSFSANPYNSVQSQKNILIKDILTQGIDTFDKNY